VNSPGGPFGSLYANPYERVFRAALLHWAPRGTRAGETPDHSASNRPNDSMGGMIKVRTSLDDVSEDRPSLSFFPSRPGLAMGDFVSFGPHARSPDGSCAAGIIVRLAVHASDYGSVCSLTTMFRDIPPALFRPCASQRSIGMHGGPLPSPSTNRSARSLGSPRRK